MNTFKQNSNIISLVVIFLMTFVFCSTISAQEKGTVKDSRDGRTYQWMKIGKKAWLVENLKYDAKPCSWFYNKDTAYSMPNGRLYTWNAAMTACPKGWILPSEGDWTQLIAKLGGVEVAGGKLQDMDSLYWNSNKNIPASAKTLSSLLGGVRHSDSTYTGISLWGGLWSATAAGDVATNYLFAHGDKTIVKSSNEKNSAFGVRCVKK